MEQLQQAFQAHMDTYVGQLNMALVRAQFDLAQAYKRIEELEAAAAEKAEGSDGV